MKKIIKKFWGVALVVMLLSSLLIIPATPAAAGNYAFSDSFALPGSVIDVSLTLAPAGNGFIDVAKSGDTMYAIGLAGGANTLYKSSDGGATWAAAVGAGLPAGGNWAYVAVPPDDPLYVVVIDKTAVPNTVYMSVNGGVSFALLNPLAAGAAINTVDISPLSTGRYITVGGSTAVNAPYIASWAIGGFSWNTATFTAAPGYAAAFPAGTDDIVAIKYVPTFYSEEDMLVITETVNSDVTLHIFSYPTAYNGWDTVDPTYPRVIEAAAGASFFCNRAVIELDETFYALANEIGFIGASIEDGALGAEVETGGVYSVAGPNVCPQIYAPATGVNSLAWDGINLMAAPYQTVAGVIYIYRSSSALSATPVFLASALYKTPGTGTLPLVAFSGGNGYCFSQGANSAIARTTDLGATFNGVKLVNQNFNNMIDFWISSDASEIYAITSDGASNALWHQSAGVWERILIFVAPNYSANWLIRSANGATDAIFLAKKGARNIVYSLNGGSTWTTRFSQQNIADLAADSASTIYYVSDTGATGAVYKGTVSTSIAWTNLGALTGAPRMYSITLVSGGFVVGALTGAVGYYDGTAVNTAGALAAGNVVATASGVAAGDTIYAASSGGGSGSFVIGTSTAFATLTAAPITFTGIAYANGVAYAFDDTNNNLYRYVTGIAADVIPVGALTFDQTNMINALQITTGSNTLWARDSATNPDTIQSYTEYLLTAVPTLTYPVSGEVIPINSISGAISAFNFMWAAPAVTVLPPGATYTIFVFYDAVGLIPVNAGGTAVGATTNWNSAPLIGSFMPGDTYYWRIQITGPAGGVTSLPSAMGSFTIQQLEAIVPEISSPPNGATIDNVLPAFSWGPIAGVTSYTFELASDPEFLLIVYTIDTTSSSAMLPVAMPLDRGETYFWRVKALTPAEGEWSQVGIFTVAEEEPTPTPTPTITPTIILPTATINLPTPTINVPTPTMPQPTVTVILPTTTEAPVEEIATPYIWAIIIIGAVLVIAVIVLIVRTRRTV
jgi:hypothetical protein